MMSAFLMRHFITWVRANRPVGVVITLTRFKVFDVAVDCVTLLHATSKCLNLRDMEGMEAWKVSFKREYIRPGSRQSYPTLARAFLF